MLKGVIATGACLLGIGFSPRAAADDAVFSWGSWELRTTPAIGFFPFGGNADVQRTQLGLYAIGSAIDLLNLNYDETRLSLLNASIYLIGLNWEALSPDSDAEFFNLGYARIGPHYRFPVPNEKYSLGAQIGYGFVLVGNYERRETKYLHGLDASFTFTWYPEYEQPYESHRSTPAGVWVALAATALAGGAAGTGYLAANGETEDVRTLGTIGAIVLGSAALMTVVVGVAAVLSD